MKGAQGDGLAYRDRGAAVQRSVAMGMFDRTDRLGIFNKEEFTVATVNKIIFLLYGAACRIGRLFRQTIAFGGAVNRFAAHDYTAGLGLTEVNVVFGAYSWCVQVGPGILPPNNGACAQREMPGWGKR